MTNNQCVECKYYYGDLSCMAYERIPTDILEGAEHSGVRDDQEVEVVFAEKVEGEDNFVPPLA